MKADNKKIARKKLRIATKRTTASSVISLITGILSIIILVSMIIVSAVYKGVAGQIIGIVPLITLIFNVAAFIIAYRQFKVENVRLGIVSAAAVINGCMVVVFLVLYLVGFYLIFK